jgi:hypothetical protein
MKIIARVFVCRERLSLLGDGRLRFYQSRRDERIVERELHSVPNPEGVSQGLEIMPSLRDCELNL